MINCLIVDDEPLAREILESHVARQPQLQLMGMCETALQAFDCLHNLKIDLMFLDIRMPGINGIDFLKSLKEPPKVIFTTAYSEYALTAFDMDVVDYLLKPITFERFQQSIHKVLQLKTEAEPNVSAFTYFKVSGKLLKIFHDDLLYVRAVKDYLLLHTKEGSHLTHMTMKGLEQSLPATKFARVHRSYIVNIAHVTEVGKAAVSVGAETIPLSDSHRAVFLKQMQG